MTIRRQSRLWITTAVAASIAASGFAVTSAQAFPARPVGLNDAAPSLTENVRYKRRYVRARRGGNAAAAAAALGVFGAIAGAAIASSQRDRYYDDGYYYAPAPSYGYYQAPGYYEAPRQRYYGPRYGYNDNYAQPQRYYGNRGYRGGYYGGPSVQSVPPGHYGSGQ